MVAAKNRKKTTSPGIWRPRGAFAALLVILNIIVTSPVRASNGFRLIRNLPKKKQQAWRHDLAVPDNDGHYQQSHRRSRRPGTHARAPEKNYHLRHGYWVLSVAGA